MVKIALLVPNEEMLEMAYARLDGAEFFFGKEIESITQEGPVFKVAMFNDDDNFMTTRRGVFAAGDVVMVQRLLSMQ